MPPARLTKPDWRAQDESGVGLLIDPPPEEYGTERSVYNREKNKKKHKNIDRFLHNGSDNPTLEISRPFHRARMWG